MKFVLIAVAVVFCGLTAVGQQARFGREQCERELAAANVQLTHSYAVECRYGDH